MSGPVTSGSTVSTSSAGASETGTSGDTGDTDAQGCDPLGDPLVECGPQQRCDLATLSCIDAFGSGVVDDACTGDDECAPAFICEDARCRQLCSPTSSPACDGGRVCTLANAPIPGLCLEPCVILQPNCSFSSDACKRGVGVGQSTIAVCVDNPGFGVEGDACSRDGDCGSGYLCTSAAQHAVGCTANASNCCAYVCNAQVPDCAGNEQLCTALGIADQPDAGYCGL